MLHEILVITNIVGFIAALFSAVLVIYHLYMMIQNMKRDNEITANLMGPFSLLISKFFTDKGSYHRRKFAVFLVITIFLISVSVVANFLLLKL